MAGRVGRRIGIDEQRTHQLFALSLNLGIATEYWDVRGNRHHASIEALLGAVAAMGYDIDGLGSVPDVVLQDR